MHPLYGALPVPYMPVWFTSGVLIAQGHTYSYPGCRISQYRRAFLPLAVSPGNDRDDPAFDGVGLAGFKSSRANVFLLT